MLGQSGALAPFYTSAYQLDPAPLDRYIRTLDFTSGFGQRYHCSVTNRGGVRERTSESRGTL